MLPKIIKHNFLILYGLGIIYLAYFVPRTDFWIFFGLIAALSLAVFLINYYSDSKEIFWLGLIIRILIFFAPPLLSDDFYRFVWDGNLIVNGVNPYELKPSESTIFDQFSIFNKLNSPDYYTIYPSVIQFINWISVLIGKTFIGSVLVMRFLFLLGELGLYFTLRKMSSNHKIINIIWVFPIVITEFYLNLHHEIWMILFVVLAIFYHQKNNTVLSATFLSLAVQVKFLPLLFLPFFLSKISAWKDKLTFVTVFCVLNTLLMFPILVDKNYLNLLESVQLYFGNFEFNSSIYKVVEIISWKIDGVKLIYKFIVLALICTYFLLWKIRKYSLISGLFWIYTIYLFTAQSVHPWYILPLLFLSYKNVKIKIWLLLWLILSQLSYITYDHMPYVQQIWVNSLEYSIVLCFLILSLRNETFSNIINRLIRKRPVIS